MKEDIQIIELTPENIADYGVCGYKDVEKHRELRNKIAWFKENRPKGLKIKALITKEGSYQGMIEYIPGELAHRPVQANGYMFIHCVFVGFKKEFKGKGFASALIDDCMSDAKSQNMHGVSVVTRKGSFMVHNKIFLKKGFKIVDRAKPDFDLLAFKFDQKSPDPGFKKDILNGFRKYKNGLTIIRSAQCPYTEKNVNAILNTAEKQFSLETKLIDAKDSTSAQNTPCAFGTFCIIYEGAVISHHPISNTRFENIMNKTIRR